MKKVEVWLYQTSEPLVHDAKSTYTKGPLYCVYDESGVVTKYPVIHIFRVVEGYGTHGGEKAAGAVEQLAEADRGSAGRVAEARVVCPKCFTDVKVSVPQTAAFCACGYLCVRLGELTA